MGERERHAPGTLSWTDLTTSDIDGAKSFYGGLFGWRFDDRPAGEGATYTMAFVGDLDVAGLGTDPQQPPHWNTYVTVESADAAAAKAADLGATVLAPPFDVLDAGRMAVVQDPTGAVIAAWEPRANIGARLVNAPGALSWLDLTTPDPDAATRFYEEWLGWTVEERPEAHGYRIIRNGERTNGGMLPLRADMEGVPPNWMPYFGTEDLDAALSRVEELGGPQALRPDRRG